MSKQMRVGHQFTTISLIVIGLLLPAAAIINAFAGQPPVSIPADASGPDPLSLVADMFRGATKNFRFLQINWDEQDNDGYLPDYGEPLEAMRSLNHGSLRDCSEMATLWLYLMALEVPLRLDPKSEPTDYILVDIVTYDAAGQVADSLRNLVFYRDKKAIRSRDIWYRCDLRRPLLVTYGFDALKDCPDVMAIRFVDGGDIDVLVTNAHPKPAAIVHRAEDSRRSSRERTWLFGDLTGRMTREAASEVADCLGVLGKLPPNVFERLAPDIIDVMDTARPGLLQLKAMEVLCEKGNADVAKTVAFYMNECVDRSCKAGSTYPASREYYDDVHRVQMFVGSDLALWSPAFRASPAIRSFLMSLATGPRKGLHSTEIMTAVDTLLDLTPTAEGRRAILLEIVDQGGAGYATAAYRLIPMADKATLASLRVMASRRESNWSIIEVLADRGDVESLPILRRLREEAVAEGHRSLPGMLDGEIQKIELQCPPQNLIAHMRDDFGGNNWYWALRRALELKLDKKDLRTAILEGATNAEPWKAVSCREFALKLGVLRPGDLADAGPCYDFGGGCVDGAVLRRKGRVVLPGSVGKKPAWAASDDDVKAFSAWFESQNFENMPKDRADSLMHAGLCKHGLLPPHYCN